MSRAICDVGAQAHGRVRQPAHRPAPAAKPHGRGRRPRRPTAVGLGLTGPLLRSTGVAYDVRRDFPYLSYDDVKFDVIIGTVGDCWDRFAIRVNEIRESVRIVRQVAEAMPGRGLPGPGQEVHPSPRNRINESMEALIHHFKLFTEGFRVAPGDAYVPVESPRGELGCYIVSDGTSRPYRLHVRAPSFANLQGLAPMARGASSPM